MHRDPPDPSSSSAPAESDPQRTASYADYGTPAKSHTAADPDRYLPEPADPSAEELAALPDRGETRLASGEMDVSRLPKPLVACGCGMCPESVDPLSESEEPQYARDVCESPRPMTLKRAAEAYLRYNRAAVDDDDRRATDRLKRGRKRYAKIMEGDRQIRAQWSDSLTTVLLSLRPASVTDDGQHWRMPDRIEAALHASWRPVRDALRYRLADKAGLSFEYVTVKGGTVPHSTPHRHVLVYADDPEDEVSMDLMQPVVETFLDQCPLAREKDHRREGGAVEIDHAPPLIRSAAADASLGDDEWGLGTKASAYLGSQLPHLDALGDDTATDAAARTGAIAWASPYDWVSNSRGLPSLS